MREMIADKWKFSQGLEEEIQYLIDLCEDDEPRTRTDALVEIIQDSDMRDHWAWAFRRELQDFGIQVGLYTARSKQQIDEMAFCGRGKKYDFKRGENYYLFNSWDVLYK
jgi:hypothetical protein